MAQKAGQIGTNDRFAEASVLRGLILLSISTFRDVKSQTSGNRLSTTRLMMFRHTEPQILLTSLREEIP